MEQEADKSKEADLAPIIRWIVILIIAAIVIGGIFIAWSLSSEEKEISGGVERVEGE